MSIDIHQDRQSDADRPIDTEDENAYQYRALSSGAVMAFVLGLLSLLAMTDYWLVAVPIVGVIWGVVCAAANSRPAGRIDGPRNGLGRIGVVGGFDSRSGRAWVYYEEVSPIPPGYKWVSYDLVAARSESDR